MTVGALTVSNASTFSGITANAASIGGRLDWSTGGLATRTWAGYALPMRGSWNTQHAMVVGSDGSLWCAGSNSSGQLGLGYSGGTVNTWTLVPGIANVRKVVCGTTHTLALCADGSVWTWGSGAEVGIGGANRYSPAVLLWGAVDVVAGNTNSLAIMADGTMRVWGNQSGLENGSMGNGINSGFIYAPWQPPNMQNVVDASFGNWLVYAVCADGSLWTPKYPPFTWQRIAPAGTYIRVAGGGPSTPPGSAFLRANGVVDTNNPGDSSFPQAGTNGLTNAVQVSTGLSHTVALLSNGAVVSWGTNDAGQFGTATTSTVNIATPQPAVGIVGNVVGVTAGSKYTMALTDVGDLYVAGDNSYGQLGLGSGVVNSNVFVLSASWASSVSNISVPLAAPSVALTIASPNAANVVNVANAAQWRASFPAVNTYGSLSAGSLAISGPAGFAGNVTLGSNLTTSQIVGSGAGGTLTISAANSIFSGNLSVTGGTVSGLSATFAGGGVTANTLTVSNLAILSANLSVAGNVAIGTTMPPNAAYQLDLTTDNARKLTTTTWQTGSDARIKANIESANIDLCLQVLKSLPLRRFEWTQDIDAQDRRVVGWIAQEVETFFPHAVTRTNERGFEDFRSLQPDQLYKITYGAIQKLAAVMDAMTAKIDALLALSAKVDALAALVAS